MTLKNWRWLAVAILLINAGSAQTLETVLDNGPPSNRVDLIFIGDGYTATQVDTIYPDHIQEELDYLFSGANRNPFPRYKNFFNAHKVTVISNESGADQPPNGIFRDTALDASYFTGGTERCLYFNTNKANTAVNQALQGSGIDIDARLGLVNDPKYGGCGGQWAVYAAENSAAADIGVHELGHSLGNLADEYFFPGTYSGPEPSEVNVTRSPNTGKWDRWVGYNDPDTNVGVIDYYEGGRYHAQGIYRPSNNSEMRSLFRPFDAVSREQFIRKFYQEVDPLDAWLNNAGTLDNPASIWVDTVDPNVIEVEWLVDGTSLGNLGENIDISSLGLATGTYSIEARAYDGILDHSFSGDSLDWWRLPNDSSLRQNVEWTVSISGGITGDFNGDGEYDCQDIDDLVLQLATGSGDLNYDLTGDGNLNADDLDQWLAEAGAILNDSGGAFIKGDANLDGVVDISDFNIWNGNKFTSSPQWCNGDFNADGVVDISDFNVWNASKFRSSDTAAVPEPSTWVLALLGLLVAVRGQR